MTEQQTQQRRTKRRYAHELYPHPTTDETRPLAVEVPYLYAQAIGLEVEGTGWYQAEHRESFDRTLRLIAARRLALLADALTQGLAGQEAWAWADQRAAEESGEWMYERGEKCGVDTSRIKPYPCGPAPTEHLHFDERRIGAYVTGPEDECPDCTEPVEGGAA